MCRDDEESPASLIRSNTRSFAEFTVRPFAALRAIHYGANRLGMATRDPRSRQLVRADNGVGQAPRTLTFWALSVIVITIRAAPSADVSSSSARKLPFGR